MLLHLSKYGGENCSKRKPKTKAVKHKMYSKVSKRYTIEIPTFLFVIGKIGSTKNDRHFHRVDALESQISMSPI